MDGPVVGRCDERLLITQRVVTILTDVLLHPVVQREREPEYQTRQDQVRFGSKSVHKRCVSLSVLCFSLMFVGLLFAVLGTYVLGSAQFSSIIFMIDNYFTRFSSTVFHGARVSNVKKVGHLQCGSQTDKRDDSIVVVAHRNAFYLRRTLLCNVFSLISSCLRHCSLLFTRVSFLLFRLFHASLVNWPPQRVNRVAVPLTIKVGTHSTTTANLRTTNAVSMQCLSESWQWARDHVYRTTFL